MRLNDDEALFLGFKLKSSAPSEHRYNPKYTIKSEDDYYKLIDFRNKNKNKPRISDNTKETKFYQEKSKVQKWLILPDVHRPFHNKVLWDKIMAYIGDNKNNIYGIVLSGDYMDMFTLGSYNADSLKNLTGITLESEYDDALRGLDEIDNALKDKKHSCKKVYIYGNHEDRYFREVAKGDNAKYGSALQSPIKALRLREKGYEVLTNWKDDFYTLGEHLDIMHGVYCGIHTAKKHLDMTMRSVMFGHTHRVQMFRQGDSASFNIGWLGDAKSSAYNYMPRMQKLVWSNGFAEVFINDIGDFYVNQISIYNDCFLINGKMY